MSQQVWLVTGCSSGFGEQFIKTILERGDKAIATARKIDSIKHLADLGAATLQLDMTDSGQLMDKKVKEAVDIYGKIDVIVQNAGYGYIATLEDIEEDALLKQFDTLVFGVVRLTQAITPYFRKQGSGHIVLVSSLASTTAIPAAGPYSGAKAAVESFIKSYAQEVKPANIKALILQPGSYRTNIREVTRFKENLPKSTTEHQALYDNVTKLMEATHDTQEGDPRLFCELAWDLVKGTGVAEGKEIPLAISTGGEAVDYELARREKDLKELQEWEGVVRKTDFPGAKKGWSLTEI
ncbi:hypothetical protein M409DRAFT_67006 [Zasmidium cellare ATCC 36951]|uniref:Uncharacterized protein n=1 Tax=Zasmidium cellare ATCC 36951 TaxID=1080233 RepID=A0A6A6CG33_ZASCE|nr:uncharacterized protein M409DRAFT_67006 [Zasmidium cellare ATCC 36951]KAF2165603.1 hypothetical protein M409DRAFT_67006 [Zasmidium cellare ATCC 36951]